GIAAAQGKAADHWHAAALEDDSLREAHPLPVAIEKSSNAYAFRVIATETRVDAAPPLKLIDEPRRRQFLRAEPPAQIEKRSHNTQKQNAYTRQWGEHGSCGEGGLVI